jgi:hypothetical protein
MTTYRNANWTKRDYDCTNIVYQVVDGNADPRRFNGFEAPAGEWVKVSEMPEGLDKLGGFGAHTFYGYM